MIRSTLRSYPCTELRFRSGQKDLLSDPGFSHACGYTLDVESATLHGTNTCTTCGHILNCPTSTENEAETNPHSTLLKLVLLTVQHSCPERRGPDAMLPEMRFVRQFLSRQSCRTRAYRSKASAITWNLDCQLNRHCGHNSLV